MVSARHRLERQRALRRKGFDLEAAKGGSNDNWLEDNSRTFDYIVVGAGSSGCALASRLVRGGKSVLVLVDGSSASSENRLVAKMRSWWRAASSRSSVVSAPPSPLPPVLTGHVSSLLPY